MKLRSVTIDGGPTIRRVPSGVQRIDYKSTHGWQLRYAGGTRFYSDGAAVAGTRRGAEASLGLAVAELAKRIARLPAPSRLQARPSAHKSSGLPVGVYGPVIRTRASTGVRDCSWSVSLPAYGGTPRRKSVYIATENTWTPERQRQALTRAIGLRREAEAAYRRAATRARRAVGKTLATTALRGTALAP